MVAALRQKGIKVTAATGRYTLRDVVSHFVSTHSAHD